MNNSRNNKMKASPKAKTIAQGYGNMPDYVKESMQRQYKGKDYTIEDKKNVVNWHIKNA